MALKIKLSEFTIEVIALVKKIPKGKIATYGQIARLAGKPHAARGVGWILNSSSETHRLPWQRVVNSKGKISFPKKTDEFRRQRKLLIKDGVRVSSDGEISLGEFQWKKESKTTARKKLTPTLFS
ncbi:MAG: MGMT family protein [Bdellovibrionota bacterium]